MKYFSIEELCKTNTGFDNTPNPLQVNNLTVLVEKVLDPLRVMYGKPIKVNSGFRSKEVNEEVGGANSSHHILGTCVDITSTDKDDNKIIFDLIKDNFEFRQLIWEKGNNNYPDWIHIEYNKSDNKKEILKFNGKNYIKI